MIALTTAAGTRVQLATTVGTFIGTRSIKRTAKNYCDGLSTIQLAPKVVGVVIWDEAPGVECTLDDNDLRSISKITQGASHA